MNPLPLPPPRFPEAPAARRLPPSLNTLRDEIAAVELRLLAREARLQRRVVALRHGVRTALKPQRSVWPMATAALLVWKLLPRGLRLGLSPATVATVVSMGVPLWRRWSGLRRSTKPGAT